MKCPVCFNDEFNQTIVLKQRLIEEWELSSEDVDLINRQQGLYCLGCLNNLRSMTLAESVKRHFLFKGQFRQFPFSRTGKNLKVLEVNSAGGLHATLKKFKYHVLAEFPNIDLQKLPHKNNTFDLIIHSDTLEHVPDTLIALKECHRVLKPGGALFYTIPIVPGRMTRKRNEMESSYHGAQDESQGEDYKVFTEYGSDFWMEIFQAGFCRVSLDSLGGLDSLSIIAVKQNDNAFFKEGLQNWCFKKLYGQ